MNYKLLLVFIGLTATKAFSQSGICFTPSFTNNVTLNVITVGDFNNDSRLDFAGASNSTNIAVYFGTGNGSFTLNGNYLASPIASLSADHQVTSGDFNNDGWVDLATSNFYGLQPDVSILLNNGNGTFASAVGITAGTSSVMNGPVAITAADINNDGNIDLAVVSQAEIYTLLGSGNGTFTANAGSIVTGLSIGHGGPHTAGIINDHFNSDSYKDVAFGIGSNIGVMFGTPSGSLTAPIYYPGSDQLASADFNGDSYRDIATSSCILLGSSSGSFAVSASYSFASQPWGVTAGDYDNNGNPDVAVQTASAIYFLHGSGNGQISSLSVKSVNTGLNMIRSFDANADTRLDIVTAGNLALQTTLLNGSFPVNVTATPSLICVGNSATLAVTGAVTTQTWSHGPTSAITPISPTNPTTYSVTVTGTTGCSVTRTVNVAVNTPTIQILASSPSLCAGETVSLTANGAQSYTWSTGAMIPGIAITPTATGVYNVAGTNTFGCVNQASVMIVVHALPAVNVQGPAQYCSGNSVTLAASGANTYTWLPPVITGSSAVFTPTASTIYTVAGANSQGCTGYQTHALAGVPNPVITVTGGLTQCAGFPQTLSASGANTYTWSTGAAAAQLTINPQVNTCYTVVGTDLNGCKNNSTFCVAVIIPTTAVAPASQTVCAGSSGNFTAATAASYTWAGGANTATLNVLTPTSSVITVTITAANGCTASAGGTLHVNNGCAWVWPGDANYDGTVDGLDVIEVGLSFSNTGPSRTGASNNYTAQYCAAWSGSVSSGANENHADCDGNGVVGISDTVAIHNNFSLNHGFRSGASTGLSLVLDHAKGGPLTAGAWNRIRVKVDSNAGAQTLYGAAFRINFDYAIIVPDSIRLEFPSSFLSAGNQNIEFRKSDLGGGNINAVTARTDKNNATGHGHIAELAFKLRSDLQEGSSTLFTVDQTGAMNVAKDKLTLGGSSLLIGITQLASALPEHGYGSMSIFPNPADDYININTTMEHADFEIYDATGRLVLSGELPAKKTFDVGELENGIYLLKLANSRQNVTRTIVIAR